MEIPGAKEMSEIKGIGAMTVVTFVISHNTEIHAKLSN
jgi:hypothetical protein